ncbi:MAG: DUF3800 domain-containing protein [Chloroflexota bacterium]
MLTFTFTADESGDTSLKFEKGASRYFVISVIATQFPDSLRSFLEDLRKELDLTNHYQYFTNAVLDCQIQRFYGGFANPP